MEENKTYGIGFKDKIGYAMGDVGSLLVFGLVNTFLQVFYTESLGITPIAVMIIMIIARLWDAINDPLWGRVVDKAKCKKKGTRYKRWLVYLCIPVSIASILMFANVKSLNWGQTAVITYATISYIVFGMLYTGINIPYGSMASVITTSDKERNALSVFRSVGSTLGGFGPMILSFVCYDKVPSPTGNKTVSVLNSNKLLIGVVVLSILSAVCFVICYKLSKERVVVEEVKKKENSKKVSQVLKELLKTRSFVVISIVGMLFLAAQMFQTTYNSYVFMKFFGNGQLAAVTQICQYLPVAVVMFFSGKLVNKFGRKEICAYGLLFSGVSFVILALLPLSLDRTILMYLFFVFSLLGGIGNSFIFLMIWALFNDTIDDYFVRTKSHDEATAYSIFIFMRKIGQTIASIIINVSLIWIGYGKDGTTNFAPSASQAASMYYQSIIIPAVLSLLMFALLISLYPLNKKKVEKLQEEKEIILKDELQENN